MVKVFKEHFSSLGALVANASSPGTWGNCVSRDTERTRADWTGTPSFEAAVDLLQRGWPEGRTRMTDAMGAIATTNDRAMLGTLAYDVAGSRPHVQRAIAGDPCNMVLEAPIEERNRPVLRLAYGNSASHTYTPEQVMNAGAAFLSVVDALEQQGFRCEITCFVHVVSTDKNQEICSSVVVKEAHDHFDVDRMAFVLAHPSMLRRIWFGHYETDPKKAAKFEGNCGVTSPMHGSPHLDQEIIALPGVGMLTGRGGSVWNTPKSAFDAALPLIVGKIRDRHPIIMLGEVAPNGA